jgi:hypothetical protein
VRASLVSILGQIRGHITSPSRWLSIINKSDKK